MLLTEFHKEVLQLKMRIVGKFILRALSPISDLAFPIRWSCSGGFWEAAVLAGVSPSYQRRKVTFFLFLRCSTSGSLAKQESCMETMEHSLWKSCSVSAFCCGCPEVFGLQCQTLHPFLTEFCVWHPSVCVYVAHKAMSCSCWEQSWCRVRERLSSSCGNCCWCAPVLMQPVTASLWLNCVGMEQYAGCAPAKGVDG